MKAGVLVAVQQSRLDLADAVQHGRPDPADSVDHLHGRPLDRDRREGTTCLGQQSDVLRTLPRPALFR